MDIVHSYGNDLIWEMLGTVGTEVLEVLVFRQREIRKIMKYEV